MFYAIISGSVFLKGVVTMIEYGVATGSVTKAFFGVPAYGASKVPEWVNFFDDNPELLIVSIIGILLVARYLLAR